MKLIATDTLAQAWLGACQHLLYTRTWMDTTIVLHMSEPTTIGAEDQMVADILEEFLVTHGQYGHHTVAETIFPAYEYITHGVEGVYRAYPEDIYPRLKHHGDMRPWGTYAYRLLRRRDSSGKEYNPLEYCIEKMRDKVRKRAAYEIGLGFGCELATYDDDEDRRQRMGGPCLSHLSFKVIDNAVHLAATYRSHYYIHRAFGNLLGLARLQAFVAEQIEAPLGPLVCHSTMAVLEYGGGCRWRKGEVSALVARCGDAVAGQVTEEVVGAEDG